MLPLKDNIPSCKYPIVNMALILANVAAFIFEISQPNLQQFIVQHGTVASRILHHLDLTQFGTIISAMFLHAGVAHIFGNLWFLFIFGDNVEDRLGHWKYLLFYIVCGIAADFTQILVNPGSAQPSIGASGAIAGVLGAYLVLFPKAEVQTMVFIWWYPMIRAWFIIGGWFLLNCLSGYLMTDHSVAWFAHIGGFMTGVVLSVLLTALDGKTLSSEDDPSRAQKFGLAKTPAMSWAVCTLLVVVMFGCTIVADVMTAQVIQSAPHAVSVPATSKAPKKSSKLKAKRKFHSRSAANPSKST